VSYQNFAIASVVSTPSGATGTSLVVTAGEGVRFPPPPFDATVWPTGALPDPTNAEIVSVTAVAGDTLTLVRGQEGSLVRTIAPTDLIANTVTAKVLSNMAQEVAFVFDATLTAPPNPGTFRINDAQYPYTLWVAPTLTDAYWQLMRLPDRGRLFFFNLADHTLVAEFQVSTPVVDQGTYLTLNIWPAPDGTLQPGKLVAGVSYAVLISAPTSDQDVSTGSQVSFGGLTVGSAPQLKLDGTYMTGTSNGISLTAQSGWPNIGLASVSPSGTKLGSFALQGNTTVYAQVFTSGQSGSVLDVGYLDASGNLSWKWTFGTNKALLCPGALSLQEVAFAALPTGLPVGALANISDSTVSTAGQVVAGGGTHHVLARYNGTNWIVVSA